jgi:hypothetical protein
VATRLRVGELLAARPGLVLRAPTPRPLHQQRRDEEALCRDQCRRRDDVALVEVPDRRLPEPDDAARWQTALGDPPPAQLVPVEQVRIVPLHNVSRPQPLTVEDPAHQLRRHDPLRGEVEKAPTDDAVTEQVCRHSVDGYTGGLGDQPECLTRQVRLAGTVLEDGAVQDDRAG